MASAAVWDRTILTLTEAQVAWPKVLIRALFVLAIPSVVLLGIAYCLLAVRRRRRRQRELAAAAIAAASQAHTAPLHAGASRPVRPGVSVLIAAYNEQTVIGRTLDSVLASTYPLLELIVVNDGSSDQTAAEVGLVWLRDERVVPIDQANTGKSGALNHGLQRARGDIIVTLDADTILTPDTIGHLVRHFAGPSRDELGAVAGVLRVGNRERNLLTRWQALEYLTQIGVERAAQDAMGRSVSFREPAPHGASRPSSTSAATATPRSRRTVTSRSACTRRVGRFGRTTTPWPTPRRRIPSTRCCRNAPVGSSAPSRRCGSTAT